MKYIFLIFSILISAASAQDVADLQLMHTTPICNHPGKTAAWCTYEDLVPSADAAGMVDKINAQIDLAVDPTKAKIYIAYFSFTNKPVYRKLCERAQAGVPIVFFLDNAYRGAQITTDLVACATNNNVRFHFMGETDTSDPDNIVWRLHHNKFLIVDSGENDQPVKINFSSGNLSAYGTSLHFDHWVTATVSRTSNMYNTHMCVVAAMEQSMDPDSDGIDNDLDNPVLYRQYLDECLQRTAALDIEEAVRLEKIAPLFSPNPQNNIAKKLISEINSIPTGQSLIGAIQHFTHSSIANALVAACERGVTVKMLMDDDVLSGESEVPGVTEFFNSYIDNTCIQVQFLQTNAASFQMMHNKFLVLGDLRVFAGAGHFTYSAMTKNYENFYLMEDSIVHQQYQALFQDMWAISMTKAEVIEDQNTPDVPEEVEEPVPPQDPTPEPPIMEDPALPQNPDPVPPIIEDPLPPGNPIPLPPIENPLPPVDSPVEP
jgi:phosphatidylserine/phosphatidylglycerophosphate/cardiolipin synthase-like enzyme